MIRTTAIITAAALGLAACAPKADKISADYVPVTRFAGLSCEQLYAETQAVAANLNATSAAQNQKANADALLVGAGLLLFWPALFATSGTLGADDSSGQIASLKGEAEGLRQAYQMKGCGA